MSKTVKKIQCKVVRSVQLRHETSEQGRSKRANRQFALTRTVRGQNEQLKPYEQSAYDTPHLNDKASCGLDELFSRYKFDEEAAQGQFLDVWA